MKLIVEKSSWSGWGDYEPKVEIEEFDDLNALLNNEKVLRTESVLSFSFIITKLGEDYIEIYKVCRRCNYAVNQ